jgi:hypothetical protein
VGQADVPQAHQFPTTVTFRLPVTFGTPLRWGPEDGEQRACPVCGKGIEHGDEGRSFMDEPGTLADRVVVSADLGTVHRACYLAKVTQADVLGAWLTIATDIASRPSRHTAAEIRACLNVLVHHLRGQP